jgi:hypothetical protein
VPDSYFVHFRQSATLGKIKAVVRDLNERSSQGGAFKVSIPAIVTRAAYGFPGKLTAEALDYVSI